MMVREETETERDEFRQEPEPEEDAYEVPLDQNTI